MSNDRPTNLPRQPHHHAACVITIAAASALALGCSDAGGSTATGDAGIAGDGATDGSPTSQCLPDYVSPLEREAVVSRLPAPLLCGDAWCRHSPWPGDVEAIAFSPGGGILVSDTLGVALWTQTSGWQRVPSAPAGPLHFVNGGGNRLFAHAQTALFEINPDGVFAPIDLGSTGPVDALWVSPAGTLWKASNTGQIHRRSAAMWDLAKMEPGLSVKSMAGTADDNIYALVQRPGRGAELDWWDGVAWTTVAASTETAGTPAGNVPRGMSQVFVTPSGRVFVSDGKDSQSMMFDTATRTFVKQDAPSGLMVKSADGTLWSLDHTISKTIRRFDPQSAAWNVVGTLPTEVWPDRLAANNQGELVNAASANGISSVLHLTGAKWKARHQRLTTSQGFSVREFAQDGPNRVLGVAGNFVIALDPDGAVLESTLLSTDPCRKVRMESLWSDGVTAVAVGHTTTGNIEETHAAIYERTSGIWQAVPMPTIKGGFRAVWGASADSLIAVGDNGLLFQRRQGSWAMATPFTAKNLVDVQGRTGFQPVVAAESAVFIAGDAGWTEYPGPADLELKRLWVSEAGNILALAYDKKSKVVHVVTVDPSQPATMWKREQIATKVTDFSNVPMSFEGPTQESLTAVVHREEIGTKRSHKSLALRIGKDGRWKPDQGLAAPILGGAFVITPDGRALLGHGEHIVSTRLPLP